jgi:hypothetical protein
MYAKLKNLIIPLKVKRLATKKTADKITFIGYMFLAPITLWILIYFVMPWEIFEDWFCQESFFRSCYATRQNSSTYIWLSSNLMALLPYTLMLAPMSIVMFKTSSKFGEYTFKKTSSKLVTIINPNLLLDGSESIRQELVVETGLYPDLESVSGSNYTHGIIKGVGVKFSQIKVLPLGSSTLLYAFKLPKRCQSVLHVEFRKQVKEIIEPTPKPIKEIIEYEEANAEIVALESLMSCFAVAAPADELKLKKLKHDIEPLKYLRDQKLKTLKPIPVQDTNPIFTNKIIQGDTQMQSEYMNKAMLNTINNISISSFVVDVVFKEDIMFISIPGFYSLYLTPDWQLSTNYIDMQIGIINLVDEIAQSINHSN